MKPEERLIVALDLPSTEEAKKLVQALNGLVSFFKVGLILYSLGGPDFVEWLRERGKNVFLDLKLFDIPETVEKTVENVAKTGVSFLTVHGNAKIIEHAVRGRSNSSLKLLAVTLLTSLDAEDIQDLGFPCSVDELVLHRAKKALACGCDGVVASGRETRLIRSELGNGLLIVTPGIRPEASGKKEGDLQKRVVTPREAITAGADYLVVGRPVVKSPQPRLAAAQILEEMASANPSP
ncbi:MAG: orotidine-5'-phosphate decarboxylase [Desulfotomaculales bacterium]